MAHQVLVEHWDAGTALLPDRRDPEIRVLVVRGSLVPMHAIRGRWMSDRVTVELFDIAIDFEGLPDPEAD